MLPICKCSWTEYTRLLRRQHRWSLVPIDEQGSDSYFNEVSDARKAFKKYHSLLAMPIQSRRIVAGLRTEFENYLGTMTAAGYFKHYVLRDTAVLSNALDCVAIHGPVPMSDVRAFFDAVSVLPGLGISTSTRLLTLKRPDMFFSVTSRTRRQIGRLLGQCATSSESYCALLSKVWAAPWARAMRPKGGEAAFVWDARVALLDLVFYETRKVHRSKDVTYLH